MRAAPAWMKTRRRTRATTMPASRTSCWYFRGTRKLEIIMTKTKRLSMLRDFSVMYPAKYSSPYSRPHTAVTMTPKTTATAMYPTDHRAASLMVGS